MSGHCRANPLPGDLGSSRNKRKARVVGGDGGVKEGEIQTRRGYVSDGDGSGIEWEAVESHWTGLRRSHISICIFKQLLWMLDGLE